MWHRVLRGAVALRQPLGAVSENSTLALLPGALAAALPALHVVGDFPGYAASSSGKDQPEAPGGGAPEQGPEEESGTGGRPADAPSQGPEEESGKTPVDDAASPYLEQLKRLKGSTSLEKQTLGGPDPPLWQQAITGTLGRILQSWASDFMRSRIDRSFEVEEFLEGSKDAFWMVQQLISNGDYGTLRGMVSQKLLSAVESTGADFRKSGLTWRTDLEGEIDARMRGVSFWSRQEIAEFDPEEAARGLDQSGDSGGGDAEGEVGSNGAAAAALAGKRPAGMWLVVSVQFRAKQRVTISKKAGGQVVAELTDLRPALWKFALGPLPEELPATGLGGWFLLSI